MIIHRHTLLVSILLVASAAFTYQYFDKVDDNTIETINKIATIKNESGFSFSVYRQPAKENVWVRFSLPENSIEQFDKKNPPIIWIGRGEPRYMATSKEFQESINAVGSDLVVYEWQPKQVAVVVWHGIVEQGFSHDIIDLLQGGEIKVRYSLDSGSTNETYFALNGMADSIAHAIDINPTIDVEAQQQAEEKGDGGIKK